jgi:geranylgeranyl diphosphate synthase type II
MNAEFETKLKNNVKIVDAALEKYLDCGDSDYGVLLESMRYSSLSGGKRARAFLCLEFFSVFGKNRDPEIILPAACALEMIHTYSLIHDDLPCMDDDDMRRGKPSNHKKYGEATALLAGDALLTYAFNIIADAELLPDGTKVRLISEISRAAGHTGMIGGQMMDIAGENKEMNIVKLIKTYTKKTGALIIAAAKSGCIAGNASEEEIKAAADYAKNIGLAFQVTDDILDGAENAAADFEYAKKLTSEALLGLENLKKINKNTETKNLEFFADYLLGRKN